MASELFKQIVAEGERALQALVDSATPEHVSLEFKLKVRPENPDFEKGDKEALGQALSALANSAGGLLIFGVRASKEDGVDCARELVPIANVAVFATAARQLAGAYLLPRHDGIRVEAVQCSDRPGFGYVVIDVDRSERRPHQSKAPGDGRYYKRAGDSTYAMEHFDIEDAFRRFAVPELVLSHHVAPGVTTRDGGVEVRQVHINMTIRSLICPARFPFLHLQGVAGARTLPFGPGKLMHTTYGPEHRFDASSDTLFNLDVEYPVAAVIADVVKRGSEPFLFNGMPVKSSIIEFGFRMGAEGCRPADGRVSVSGSAIAGVLGIL